MDNEAILILDTQDIENRLVRLAFQIYEENFEETEINICGIQGRGFILAEKIAKQLEKISPLKVNLTAIEIDKLHPNSKSVTLNPPLMNLSNQVVVLCDDVLYTGKTMAHATVPFLEAGVRKIQCLTLIDRNHLAFPVQPIFTGLSLSTTLQERVEVDFELGKVWLKE